MILSVESYHLFPDRLVFGDFHDKTNVSRWTEKAAIFQKCVQSRCELYLNLQKNQTS